MTKAVIIEIKRDHNNTPSYVVLGIPRFLSTKADRRSDHITSKHASHARHHASRVPYHVRLRIGATARRWGSPALRICQRESRPGEASDRGRTRMLQRGEAVSANGTTLSASANRWRRCGCRQAARTGSHKLHALQMTAYCMRCSPVIGSYFRARRCEGKGRSHAEAKHGTANQTYV